MVRRFFKALWSNLPYKVFSLFIAVIIWRLVQGEQIQEVVREITIVLNVPPSYMVRGETQILKGVTIKGPRSLILEAPKIIEAHIEVPAKVGRFRKRLSRDSLEHWNDRLQIEFHEPVLSFVVDEKLEKILLIKENIQGVPDNGLSIDKVVIKPKSVKVTGLKTDLKNLKFISTELIDISGLTESRSYEVGLSGPGLGPENFSENRIVVSVQLTAKP